MASREWIESAAHERGPLVGGHSMGNRMHTLAMARADERREARDRVLADRAVRRIGGEHAGELLAMLGLAAS
jgi:hypothetical protein